MEKRFVFRFSFFDLKNENEKMNRFSFILLNFFHVKCNCGIVHGPRKVGQTSLTLTHLLVNEGYKISVNK